MSEKQSRRSIREQVVRLYREEKLSLRQIAERFSVTHQAVHCRLTRAGVILRGKGPYPEDQSPWPPPVDKEVLYRLYVTDRLPIEKVAESLATTYSRVSRWLKFYEIPRRGTGPVRLPSLLDGLAVGESVVVPRKDRKLYQNDFHSLAKNRGMRISVRTIDQKTARVTRLE